MNPLPSVETEFESAALGDRRLDRRLSKITARLARSPAASFPKLVCSIAEREAFYRFVENDRVDWERIVEPHHVATASRCREERVIRIAHDTTWFSFEGARSGLGPVSSSSRAKYGPRGYAGHFSIASSDGDVPVVMGVLALSTFVRSDTPTARTKEARKAKHLESKQKPRNEKESSRWMDNVRSSEARLGKETECIHVMDQEADSFAILADLVQEKRRFVVRGSADRLIHPRKRGISVEDALIEQTAHVFRTVPITSRSPRSGKHKNRSERNATLMIRARSTMLSRPETAQHAARTVPLHVVQVFEAKPPDDETPIEWTLFTTEAIGSASELAAIVDHYRTRWVAEEFFKALKTGCAYEKRQLESYDALRRALALLVPMAWHLLAIRSVARRAGKTPASHLVDALQLDVLRALSPSSKLPTKASAADVMRAIADLGGHIRQNGEPGWIVLARGYEDFVKAEHVWRAALAYREK